MGLKKLMCFLVPSQNGDVEEDDEPVDIEGDGDTDSRDVNEYDWNNRRILKSSHNSSSKTNNNSLFRYYYEYLATVTAINMTTSKRRDDEIDVDGDEISTYGCPHYTEADIQAALKSPGSSPPAREQDAKYSKENNKWSVD